MWAGVLLLAVAGVVALVVRHKRNDDEIACAIRRMGAPLAQCHQTSYLSAIVLAVVGGVLILVARSGFRPAA